MPKEILKRGATSNIIRVFLQDSASTTGAGKTALTSTSSGLIISTIADLEATATTYTSAATNVETITTLGTFAAPTASKCRFREVDATNFPGVYEIQIADARFAVANSTQLLISIQCTGVAPVFVEYQLVAVDLMDTVRFGLTALPNVAQGTSGALSTGNASGQVTVATNNDKTGYSLTQTFPANFNLLAINGSGAVTAGTVSDKTGYSLTQTFPTNFNLLAINGSGAVTAGTVSDKTGYSLSVAPPTAAQIWATDVSGYTTAGQAGTYQNKLDAAITTRMASFTYTTPPTASAIATQVWSEALPGSYTSGQAGFKLNAAGSAADPWSTALPGSYTSGSAGFIIGTNLNATVSSRSTLAATDVWSATTRTLSAGTNIVLAKNTGITGFNDITAQSVWDVLSSAVVLTNSIGLQLKTNIDATVSSRLPTSSYTAPLTAGATASAVWDALLASYTVNNSFGQRVLRSTSSQSTCAVTGSSHIAADVHELQPAVITAADFSAGAIDANALAADATAEIADRVLGRTISGGADGGRNVTSALRILRNKFTAAATTLTVYAEDDTTTAWTSTLSTDAGATPITGSDPT